MHCTHPEKGQVTNDRMSIPNRVRMCFFIMFSRLKQRGQVLQGRKGRLLRTTEPIRPQAIPPTAFQAEEVEAGSSMRPPPQMTQPRSFKILQAPRRGRGWIPLPTECVVFRNLPERCARRPR